MMSALIIATLVVVFCSLWIRRHTWRSRWEVDASLNIALQGCAVLLMSPWASETLGPPLHDLFGRWNVEDLVGHICLMFAAAAIVEHGLARLGDNLEWRRIFRRHIEVPLWLGVPVLVAVFFAANETYHSDLFPAHVSTAWFAAYWIVLGVLLVYLFGYAARVMLIVRKDPRSTVTATLYLISAAFGLAATVIQVTTAEAGIDITLPVWLCACLGAVGFAYGSARSWLAKVAWFDDVRVAPPPRKDC
ncbi:hypothetical protein PT015_11070 [Candidatus Mycobacterium wuenschmannii]|uniref:GP55 protein n=1 Tax=Candidatus Mycobacterium wuenschmannii TaxID=3027808 RepID=A0ABY8W2F9_9MYCO|nr:hypothetical protein [Candidatus Mycobacterium wuenschmannii]WIM89912.1 hypothetical protein PT015_11070 [Candidatus Mycobacterium wuenschmannii]